MRIVYVVILGLVAHHAVAQNAPGKRMKDMSPEEVEAVSRDLMRTCERAGISTGSRDFDACVKREARKRGLI